MLLMRGRFGVGLLHRDSPTPSTIITFRTLSFGSSGFGLEELFLVFSINPPLVLGGA
jgi:hypothetical protein